MALFSSLPSTVQTSALSVAVHRRSSQPVNHVETSSSSAAASHDIVVSLHQYLSAAASCADVPLQLPASAYALTVSPHHFDLMRRARVDGCDNPAALARLVVADVAAEAATELARAFEYQLMLLDDEEGLAARLGAQRGADRAMEYLQRNSRHIDVNSLMRGVVDGRPFDAPASVSAIIGRRCELHWNVDDMFLRPGLRRERLLVAGGVDILGGYGTPWRLYASTDGTDAPLYGYRGQLLARDFHSEWLRGGRQPSYHLDVDEEAAYDVEVPLRSVDFHRTYRPYRRLVGTAVMASYAALSEEEKLSLNLGEFVQRLQGDAFRRDEVEPVFKPLTSGFCREEFTGTVRNHMPDSKANPNFTPLREFCREEPAPSSNSMPENKSSTYVKSPLPAVEHHQEEFVPMLSSTLNNNNSPTFQPVKPVRDRTRLDQVPVGLNRPLTFHGLCPEVSISETSLTRDEYDENISEANQCRNSTQTDQRGVCSTTPKRRPPPPAVKPKPSLELRRRLSAVGPATTVGNSHTMTSLPVTRRQSSAPIDGSDSTPEVAVRFPTLDELFGRELAAIRHASTQLPGSADTDNSRQAPPSFSQHTGSTNMTSSPTTNDVRANDSSSQLPTSLLISNI